MRVHLRRARGAARASGSSTGLEHLVVDLAPARAASRAVRSSSAATAASTSPTQRTSSPSATKPGQSWLMQPVPALAGHVRGGGHRAPRRDAPRPRRCRCARTRARGCSREHHRAVEHARAGSGRPHRAARRGPARRPGSGARRCAHAARRSPGSGIGLAALRPRPELDGVDDLHVAGAAAEVAVDGPGDLLAAWASGCGRAGAWPAGRSPGCRSRTADPPAATKARAMQLALLGGDALEGEDLLARRPSPPAWRRSPWRLPSMSARQQPHWPWGWQPSLRESDPAALAQRVEQGLARPRARSHSCDRSGRTRPPSAPPPGPMIRGPLNRRSRSVILRT